MATAHQFLEYSSGGNDFYGTYHNQPSATNCASSYDTGSSYYTNCTSNTNVGHFNADHNATVAMNQNISHYPAQSNWSTQTAYANNNNNSHHQQQQQPQSHLNHQHQYYSSNAEYASDQYHHQHQQQYQSPRFTSPTYNGGVQQQLNRNHNYPESPKVAVAYQSNVTAAPAPASKPIENCAKESSTGPLRALLSNKRLRYSPNYAKRNAIVCAPKIDTVTLSPVKTDDSLDLFDDFAFAKRQPIVDAVRRKHGYESENVQSSLGAVHSPTTMTSEIMMGSQKHSPMTNYVDGLSTPPLSPKEVAIEQPAHVNQMPASMIDDAWTNASNECKYFRKQKIHPTRIHIFLAKWLTNFHLFPFFSFFRFLQWFLAKRSAHAKPTVVNKHLNWKRSSTAIATWRADVASKSRKRCVSPNVKLKFGSRIDAWKRKKIHKPCHRWAHNRISVNRRTTISNQPDYTTSPISADRWSRIHSHRHHHRQCTHWTMCHATCNRLSTISINSPTSTCHRSKCTPRRTDATIQWSRIEAHIWSVTPHE